MEEGNAANNMTNTTAGAMGAAKNSTDRKNIIYSW
jgi:hypothetical protein